MSNMTFDEWKEKYVPVIRKSEQEPDNFLFETYGDDLDVLRQYKQGHIWTLINGSGSSMFIIPGIRWIDRLNYIITETPWTDDDKNIIIKW
jgi:hypothetical protein